MNLHLTNGDSVGDPLRRLFPADTVAIWRDSLSGQGEIPPLSGHYAEIVLWFEHDLYDQAQLIEALSLLQGRTGVRLIQASSYLGHMEEEELLALWPLRMPVSAQQSADAREAWSAFSALDPTGLCRVEAPSLPYVRAALLRRAREYPWVDDGCSLTERGILLTVRAGLTEPGRLFERCSVMEDPRWMGDTHFFTVLDGLKSVPEPLIDAHNRLTTRGQAVLELRDDRRRGMATPWRWDRASGAIVPYPAK